MRFDQYSPAKATEIIGSIAKDAGSAMVNSAVTGGQAALDGIGNALNLPTPGQ